MQIVCIFSFFINFYAFAGLKEQRIEIAEEKRARLQSWANERERDLWFLKISKVRPIILVQEAFRREDKRLQGLKVPLSVLMENKNKFERLLREVKGDIMIEKDQNDIMYKLSVAKIFLPGELTWVSADEQRAARGFRQLEPIKQYKLLNDEEINRQNIILLEMQHTHQNMALLDAIKQKKQSEELDELELALLEGDWTHFSPSISPEPFLLM